MMEFLVPKKNLPSEIDFKYAIYIHKLTSNDTQNLRSILDVADIGSIGNMGWQRPVTDSRIGDAYIFQMNKTFETHLKKAPEFLNDISMIILPPGVNGNRIISNTFIDDNFILFGPETDSLLSDAQELRPLMKPLLIRSSVQRFPGFLDQIEKAKSFDPFFDLRYANDESIVQRKLSQDLDNMFKVLDIGEPSTSTSNVTKEVVTMNDRKIAELLAEDEMKQVDDSVLLKKKVGKYVLDVMIHERNPIRCSKTNKILVWDTIVPEGGYVVYDQVGRIDFKSASEIAFNGCPNSIVLRWLVERKSGDREKNELDFGELTDLPAWMTFSIWFNGFSGYALETKKRGARMFHCDDFIDAREVIERPDMDGGSFLLYFFQNASVNRIINSFYPK